VIFTEFYFLSDFEEIQVEVQSVLEICRVEAAKQLIMSLREVWHGDLLLLPTERCE
jgi:hypothetical protein